MPERRTTWQPSARNITTQGSDVNGFLTLLVVMMVFALAINLFMVAGFTGYVFSHWRGPDIFSF